MKNGQPFNPFGLFHGIFIPDAIKESYRLTSHAKLLMGQLLHYSGKNGKAFPSRKKLCKDLNFSMSMLDRSIRLLKKERLIDTYQLTEHSPSTYIFLYNSIYYDANHNTNGGTVICDSGGTVICDKHKEINKERDHKRKRNFSTKNSKLQKDTGSTLVVQGRSCGTEGSSILNPSGNKSSLQKVSKLNGKSNKTSCKVVKSKTRTKRLKNKQNLAKSKNDEPSHKKTQNLEPLPTLLNLPKLKKIKIEPNPLIKFNFPQEVFGVLNHWRILGGKIPKDPNRRKIADTIATQIQELLIKGNNPYTSVLKDNELDQFRIKKWTVQEINDSATYFKKELCKPIEDMTFLQFIIHRNFKTNQKLRDFSPLVNSFSLLPQELSFIAKKIKDDFTTYFPDIHFYDKTFINIATFLEEKLKIFKSEQPYGNFYFEHRFVNEIFYHYMKNKLTPKGTYDELKYMANPQNLKEFIQWCSKLNLIKRRTNQEMREHKKILKEGLKNQIKAYQMDVDSGKAETWNEDTKEYFEFIKEQAQELAIC